MKEGRSTGKSSENIFRPRKSKSEPSSPSSSTSAEVKPPRKGITNRSRVMKGTLAERQAEAILNREGVPTVRVLGSGRFVSTDGDLKISVPLRRGSLPAPDECTCLLRGEVKNHKQAPKKLFALHNDLDMIFYTVDENVKVKGLIGSALKQRAGIQVALIRDPNPSPGAIKNLDTSMFAVVIRLDALIKLIKGYHKWKQWKRLNGKNLK